MGFVRPDFLWGLLVLPLLLILSFWKMRPIKVLVPSLALWKKIPERNPPLKAVRRPYFSLSTVLQALALLSAVGGAAGFSWTRVGTESREVIVLLDTSPAMMVLTESGRSRLDAARERLDGLLNALDVHDRVTLICQGRIQQEARRTPSEARRILSGIRPSFLDDGNLERMLALARMTARDSKNVTLVLASWHDLVAGEGRATARRILVGGDRGNMGIVEWNHRPGTVDGKLFVRVESTFLETKMVPLRIHIDGTEWAVLERTIQPGSNALELDQVIPSTAAEIRITLGLTDRLSWDNTLTLQRAERPFRVTLTGQNHPLLVKALSSLTGVEVSHSARVEASDRSDLAIFNRALPPPSWDRDMVVIQPPAGWSDLVSDQPVPEEHPDVSSHPFLQDLPLEQVRIRTGRALRKSGERDTVVMSVRDKPVMILLNKGGDDALIVSFDINSLGDVRSGPSWYFPVFWNHVCGWFQKKSGRSPFFEAYRSGEAISVGVTEDRIEVERVDDPDPAPVRAWKDNRGRWSFTPDRVGAFRLKGGSRRWVTSLLDISTTGSVGEKRLDPLALERRKEAPVPVPLDAWCVLAFAVLALSAWVYELKRGRS